MGTPSIFELGIVGLALVVTWRMTELLKMWWLTKDGKASNGTQYMTKLQCMSDPTHFERQKQTHKMVEWLFGYSKANEPALKAIREGVPKGQFGCAWKDRDEVLALIQAMKELATAMNYQTAELRKQNGK